MKNFIIGLLIGIVATASYFRFLYSPGTSPEPAQDKIFQTATDSIPKTTLQEPAIKQQPPVITITGQLLSRDSLINFAKTLIGVPYLYGSVDPARGFDCSGFITYVFNHFNIKVPRSSYEFENAGKKLSLAAAQKGDLLLFTGTNPQEKTIGHIGIVIDTTGGKPRFIHSSSGKALGVTITSMESSFYQERFVSVVDIISK